MKVIYRKGLQIVFLTIILSIFATQKAFALPQFSTDYLVKYDISENGNTHVTFAIDQKNNLSSVYATTFSLSLSQTDISNIKIIENDNEIEPLVKKTANSTNIQFDFKSKIVGKDKVSHFTIGYDTSDILNMVGQIKEINIPRLETNENTNNVAVVINAPIAFGQAKYLDPKPNKTENNSFQYLANNLANKPISIIFGDNQYYQVKARYNLENNTNQTVTKNFTLPPNTSYQKVFIKTIDPKPKSAFLDQDGNWIAQIDIAQNSKISINAELIIKVSLLPNNLALNNPTRYTLSTKYWDYNNAIFQEKNLPSITPKSIYDFVVSSLSYDFAKTSRLTELNQRNGASWALSNPTQAICTEFADLFIALARKANIPSREIVGYAISNNPQLKPSNDLGDVLHSWPEYYDPSRQTWIEIDPTWGNTTNGVDYFNKLDLNHIAFVIHGSDPYDPLPAGAYKFTNSPETNLNITITDPINIPPPTYSVKIKSIINNMATILVENIGQSTSDANISIPASSDNQEVSALVTIIPYGSTEIKLPLKSSLISKSKDVETIIYINDQKFQLSFTRESSFTQPWAIAIILGIIGGLTLIARGLYISRKKQRTPIHW